MAAATVNRRSMNLRVAVVTLAQRAAGILSQAIRRPLRLNSNRHRRPVLRRPTPAVVAATRAVVGVHKLNYQSLT